MKRDRKLKDLTRSSKTRPMRDIAPLEHGKAFLGTRAESGRSRRASFKDLTDKVTAELRRHEQREETRALPATMKSIAERVVSKPVGKWDAKDFTDLEKYFDASDVRRFRELSDKRFKK